MFYLSIKNHTSNVFPIHRKAQERTFDNCTGKELQVPVFKDGKLVYKLPSLEEIRSYVQEQMREEMWPEEQRFENPHVHYLDMTPNYYDMKMELLYEVQK